jgi:hypothetical protein
MRELIELLSESVGLSNRTPGEKFIQSNTGKTITFQSLSWNPAQGKYNSPEELHAAVSKFEFADQIIWSNRYNRGMGGFGIAHFTDDATGDDLYFGRYLRQVSPNPTNNSFPNNAVPGGYQYRAPAAQKEHVGYKPSDILTQFENNTPTSIYKQVADKFGVTSAITQATKIFIESDTFPVVLPLGDIDFAGFRDYFCELLHPIALVKGMPVAGDAASAEQAFFGDVGFTTCKISFNAGSTDGLSDSLLTNADGQQIKLSSKGKTGAKASAVNLLNSIEELRLTPAGTRLIDKYKEEIGIVQIVKDYGHFMAPLQLAVIYGIIDASDVPMVTNLKNYNAKDKIISTGILSSKLESLYAKRSVQDPSRIIPREHLTAAIAYKVADYVNKNTNFSKAASDILNHSALVQIYTDAQQVNDTIVIKQFRAVYPSASVTSVEFSAQKTYYSTGGKGNFVFNILHNGAKSSDVLEKDTEDQIGRQERVTAIQQKISDIGRPQRGIRPTGALVSTQSDRKISEPREKR